MNLGGVRACCAVCKVHTRQRCSRCLSIYYCNTEHQRQDWRRHKRECAPKLLKQGLQKDKVDDSSTANAEDSKGDRDTELADSKEASQDLKTEGSSSESRQSRKSKRISVKKEGRDGSNDNIPQVLFGESDVRELVKQQRDADSTLKDASVISSVVYTNRDLTGDSAIVYEGSSEQEILSESAQQLSTLECAASTSNVLKANKNDKMLAIPGYPEQNMRTKEYPEASVRGSGAPFSNTLNSVCMEPNDPCYAICQRVIKDMTQYGVCVLNNFLGKERGLLVLKEVLDMYSSGIFTAGQLVSNPGSTEAKTVRSDRITWIDGKEPHCYHIGQLITQVDNIVLKANKMANNGKMGNYVIHGRTKAMVACYPGSGTHYVKHVDNPNKDGRCITAIYYLNLDWDKERHGGLLRVFPEGTDKVADIEPIFDRMLFFWSDRRNPHEVQPAYSTRYAITLWYFDSIEREEACQKFKRAKPSES